MGFKFRITLTSSWPIPNSRTKSLVIGLALCSIWQPRSKNPSELQRETRPKDAGETVEGSHQLKFADKAVAADGEAVVGVIGVEAEVAGATMT